MKRCPQCEKFGVEYDPYTGTERCLWDACLWFNKNNEDLDKKKFKINYLKFRESLHIKKKIAV